MAINVTTTTPGASVSAATISFTAPDTISDSGSGFGVFSVGEGITISGSIINNGNYTIATAAAGVITVEETGYIESEVAGAPVVIDSGVKIDLVIGVSYPGEPVVLVHPSTTDLRGTTNNFEPFEIAKDTLLGSAIDSGDVTMTVDGEAIPSAAVLVTVGSGFVGDDLGAESLADTLVVGNTSGGTNIQMTTTDQVQLGGTVNHMENGATGNFELTTNKAFLFNNADSIIQLENFGNLRLKKPSTTEDMTMTPGGGAIGYIGAGIGGSLDMKSLLSGATKTWSMPNETGVVSLVRDFTTTYYVAADYGDDTNDGLSLDKAFATLDAALDAVTTGAVSAAITLLGDSTYTVTETTGTPNVRTTAVKFSLFGEHANIQGQPTGVTWVITDSRIDVEQVDGTDLIFKPGSGVAGTFEGHYHNFKLIKDPITLYKTTASDPADYRWCISANRVRGEGPFCNFDNAGKAFMYLDSEDVRLDWNTASTEYMFIANNANSIVNLNILNIDSLNSGAGVAKIFNLTNGASAHAYLACYGGGATNGGDIETGSTFYGRVSTPTGNPVTFTVSGGSTVHTTSDVDGLDFSNLPTTAGLALADLTNVRDIGTGRQKQATLTQLQALIIPTKIFEFSEAETEANTSSTVVWINAVTHTTASISPGNYLVTFSYEKDNASNNVVTDIRGRINNTEYLSDGAAVRANQWNAHGGSKVINFAFGGNQTIEIDFRSPSGTTAGIRRARITVESINI